LRYCSLTLAGAAVTLMIAAGDAMAAKSPTIYSFTGGSDGGYPLVESLIADTDGNLYGTASSGGGSSGYGVVFKMTPSGDEAWVHAFAGGSDGTHPQAGLTYAGAAQGKPYDGKSPLYGTTSTGGPYNYGTLFTIGGDGKIYKTLYSFTGGADGGNFPYASFVDKRGNVYGTTMGGGTSQNGVVFKVSRNGTEKTLYSFTGSGSDGGSPIAGVIQGPKGVFYGTTTAGNSNGAGSVFAISRKGKETTLHQFDNSDGGDSTTGLLLDRTGNLYGTTSSGGPAGNGTVFQIAADGTFSTLYSFTNGSDGGRPWGTLIERNGFLYGTTTLGGTYEWGTAFKLTLDGKSLTPLYEFGGDASDGLEPTGGLVFSKKFFFGTTQIGGADGAGTVFKLKG
jgi:uncharacterized repeat protein (TIGR03803 family)